MSREQISYFGLETEYGFGVRPVGFQPGPDQPDYLIPHATDVYDLLWSFRGTNSTPLDDLPGGQGQKLHWLGTFMQNGGRLYGDFVHPEYATPPVTDLDSMLAYDIAGERLITAAVNRTVARGQAIEAAEAADPKGSNKPASELTFRGITAAVLNKRVLDEKGKTWGYHESYLVPRELFDRRFYNDQEEDPAKRWTNPEHKERFDLLSAFLVTRTLFCGAGGITGTGDGARFVVGQKAAHLDCDYHEETVEYKPVMNLRDEPHASQDYSRLHITCGDPHLSPWAQKFQVGTTLLALAVIADGARFGNNMKFALPFYRVARQVSRDVTGSQKIDLANGGQTSALEVQQQFLRAAQRWAQGRVLTPDQQWTLEQWEYACRKTAEEGIHALRDRAEWPAKYRWVTNYLNHKNQEFDSHGLRPLTLGSRLILGYEIAWDQLNNPEAMGLRMRERSRVWRENMPSEAAIQAAMTVAPLGLAALRGRFISTFHGHPDYYRVDWNKLEGYGRSSPERASAPYSAVIAHPSIGSHPTIDAMLAAGPDVPARYIPNEWAVL